MTQVPDHAAFPTVDAMHADLDAAAAAHPDLVVYAASAHRGWANRWAR
ncbi:hypothetical protein [Embleya scabrispora]|nr:hypothetical protein [Embleya scabrispora]